MRRWLSAAILLLGCNSDRMQPIAPPGGGLPVDRLSRLGLFASAPAEQIPESSVLPYEIVAPSYSDHATKRRFLVMPPGTQLHPTEDRWEIPIGSYLIKTFSYPIDARDPSLGERHVETRFLVRTSTGMIGSVYLWNEGQTDAFVSAGNVDVPVWWIDRQGATHQGEHHVPGTSTCDDCHRGRALGLRSRQLDRDGQLERWAAEGIVDAIPPPHLTLTDPFGKGALDLRARSYLETNCAHCHGTGGSAASTGLFWDLEHTTRDRLPHVVEPGHPERSLFLARMKAPFAILRMPRGPNRTIDEAGVKLLERWVTSMAEATPDLRGR